MTAYTSAGEINFSFRHEHFAKGTATGPFPAFHPIKAFTMCWMRANGTNIAAYAYCSQSDQFNKEKGRKLALRKALQKAGLSRKDRRLVWEAYFDRLVPTDIPWKDIQNFGFNYHEAAV